MRWSEVRRWQAGEGTVALRRRQTLLVARGPAQMLIPRRRWQVIRTDAGGEEVLVDTKDEATAWSRYRTESGDHR
jgi:hypothetical protein